MRMLLLLAMLLAHSPGARASDLIRPGDPFPAWTLTDQTGASLSSKDMAGKIYVLWFFPRAMTPGCTAEGRGFRDEIEGFRKRGVEILGVSFDAPDTNAEFVKAERFPFRLLSDQDRKLATAVGAADDQIAAVARRVSYVVGPDGRVRKVYGTVTPASHAKEVLGDLPPP
jgi:thioredoxin-dependent peroxiredoxin